MSMPNQFQHLADKKFGEGKVNVINGGVVTYNTTQVRNQLLSFVKEKRIDYAIVMAGGANSWNFVEYKDNAETKSLISSLFSRFRQLKIGRLVTLLLRNIKEQFVLIQDEYKTQFCLFLIKRERAGSLFARAPQAVNPTELNL